MYAIGNKVFLTQETCNKRDINNNTVFTIDDITFDEIDNDNIYVLFSENGLEIVANEYEIEEYNG